MEIFHRFDVRRRAELEARRIAPTRNRVDATGRDQDDYAQMFLVKMWQAGQSFQPTEGKANNLKAWTAKAVRNLSFSFKRELSRAPSTVRADFLLEQGMAASQDAPEFCTDTGLEPRVMARHLLGKIRLAVDGGDWDFLMDFMANDCSPGEMWRDQGKSISSRGFLKRVDAVKGRVKRKLQYAR